MKRRDFIKLGSLAAAAGALPLLRGSPVLGAPAAIPKRVVFVYFSDGMLLGDAEPKPPAGASNYDASNFEFSACMKPLEALRADMLLFQNLDMVSATVDPTGPANAHLNGETHALTGSQRLNDSLPGSASIDQFIAQQLGGTETALRSLEIFCSADMAYNDGFKGPRKIPSTSAAGQQVDALGRPDEIYDRVFGSAPMTSDMPADNSAALARQQRLFDFLRGQHAEVGARLPQGDRDKLDQHMQYLSDIEASRRLLLNNSDRQSLWPARSMVQPAVGLDWTYNAAQSVWYDRYQLAVPLNMKLVAAALHADITRVVTVALDPPPASGLGFSDGMFGATDFHDLVHKTNDTTGNSPQQGNPDARDLIISVVQNALDKVRVLGEELAMLQEPDGSRLLDHTLVVFTSQIAYGNHQLENLPWFTLGNIDGYFSPGRVLTFPRTTDPKATWRTNGRAHNDLFVSVANALGLAIDKFGREDVCSGAISEMRG